MMRKRVEEYAWKEQLEQWTTALAPFLSPSLVHVPSPFPGERSLAPALIVVLRSRLHSMVNRHSGVRARVGRG